MSATVAPSRASRLGIKPPVRFPSGVASAASEPEEELILLSKVPGMMRLQPRPRKTSRR